jgi:hypothetical protein
VVRIVGKFLLPIGFWNLTDHLIDFFWLMLGLCWQNEFNMPAKLAAVAYSRGDIFYPVILQSEGT